MEDIVMSKWRKPLKNKKRFDARYFLSERVENQEAAVENSVQQEELKKNFHDFSFDDWIAEGHDGATKGHAEESPATKKRELKPFDYDKGEIADEVFEESVIGSEEEEEDYGEQEADDSESTEAAPCRS